MSGLVEPIRQLSSHWKLLSRPQVQKPATRLALDAIVVPASRPAGNLDQAVTLARASRSALLILCSHRAKPDEVRQLLAERSFNEAVVIDLPDGYSHGLLDFRALASIKNDLPGACSYYVTDLSTKRNVGLILARMLGWRHIFFLDDDIRDIGYADLQNTVDMLGSYHTAGMRVTFFPDNSAACHAHRMTGGLQDVFISGAALAVDCQQDVGFFPDVYNEDWLFLYDDAAHKRVTSSGRTIAQLRYFPFDDPKRAGWQEFGDTLAEGLYYLLDRGMNAQHATPEYWIDFLNARRTFLKAIINRSDMAGPEIREPTLCAIEAALKCSAEIPPELLERYTQLWQQDLRAWKQRVSKIRQMPSFETALRALRLPSVGNR